MAFSDRRAPYAQRTLAAVPPFPAQPSGQRARDGLPRDPPSPGNQRLDPPSPADPADPDARAERMAVVQDGLVGR